MTEQERFDKENEIIADIIQRGGFLNAKQGIQVGKWITEGLAKGLTQPPVKLWRDKHGIS